MIRRLAERLFRADAEKQADDHRRPGSFTRTVITGNGSLRGVPMLTRWRIIQNRHFGLYVHEWHRPDSDRDCHDHPWWFGTMILRGGYTEEVRVLPGDPASWVRRHFRRPFTWHAMPLNQAHRVVEVKPNTWTLLLVGPKVKSWGFYVHGRQQVAGPALSREQVATLNLPASGWEPVVWPLREMPPEYVHWETYIAQGGNPDPFNC